MVAAEGIEFRVNFALLSTNGGGVGEQLPKSLPFSMSESPDFPPGTRFLCVLGKNDN